MSLEVCHRIDDGGRLRLGIVGRGEDWLGPGSPIGPEREGWTRPITVQRGRPQLDLGFASSSARRGVARSGFTDLLLGWRFAPTEREAFGIPEGARALGFQVAEFAFPSRSDETLAKWALLPHRPSALGLLLLVAPDGTTLLLAPAIPDQHSLTIAVGDGTVGVGLHGDLDELPEGFTAWLSVLAAETPGEAVDVWGEQCRGDAPRPDRYADALGSRLSYWTDNGAAYWYRTEPGHTPTTGIAAAVADLVDRGVPIGSVQVDSWWYPHEVLRPFDTDEWVVPPTGMLAWEARPDVLPDGLAPLRDAIGGLPLAAHCRHLSARSPYVDRFPSWVDGSYAHPSSPAYYEHLLDRCVDQGIATFEHDWLVECFTGVRQLRAEPSRPVAWQRGIDDAAAERDRTLQWCMATLADMVTAAALPRITSVRTSGDHGYLAGPGFLWAWFLVVNRLARPLGLHPFKDVFLAGSELAPVDALLSTLSTGPVGIGDRLGQADASVLRPCHRADGLLVKPDVPIAATDDAFRSWPFGRPRPLVGESWTDHGAGRWRYVVALNPDDRATGSAEAIDVSVPVTDGCVVWDWRTGSFVDAMSATGLAAHDWRYWVEVPVVNGVAVVGDASLYATAGDLRIGSVAATEDGVAVVVLGAGEQVSLTCWSADRGSWTEGVDVPASGSVDVALHA